MDEQIPEKKPDLASLVHSGGWNTILSAGELKKKFACLVAAAGGESADLDIVLRAAIEHLGPPGLPPPHVLSGLRRLVLDCAPLAGRPDDLVERVWEAAVAYGCGKWRAIKEEARGWEARWPTAQRALAALFEKALVDVDRTLRKSVGLSRPNELKKYPPGNGLDPQACHLTMQFLRPLERICLPKGVAVRIVAGESSVAVGLDVEVPPGGKHVFEIGKEVVCIEIEGELRHLKPGAWLAIACSDDGAEIRLHPKEKNPKNPVEKRKKFIFRLKPGESAELRSDKEGAELFVRECTCGSTPCAERHRLEAWDPAVCSLADFVDAAVKGLKPGKVGAQAAAAPLNPAVTQVKGEKPGAGKARTGIGSLPQGMYYQLLNRGVEALVGDNKHRLHVRLRTVPVAAKQCTCNAFFLDDCCPKCGAGFDPKRMKVVKRKALLIMEGVGPEDHTWIESLGKSFERKAFLRCNARGEESGGGACDHHVEFSQSLLADQTWCHGCRRPLYPREELRQLIPGAATILGRWRILMGLRGRLVIDGAVCPHCGTGVEETPLRCPVCHSCNFGQNLVFLFVRRPPVLVIKPREAASRDDSGDGDEDDPGPGDPGPDGGENDT